MPKGNLKQGWWHNQKPQNVSETNFKALSCKQQLKKKTFDPFKVHPGLQQPKGPWVQELQLSDAAANNTGKGRHAENGERKKKGQKQTN